MIEQKVILPKYTEDLKTEMRDELTRLLKYWIDNAIDEKYGGFLGERDFYNCIVEDAEKGAVLNARILWTFSAAYNFTKDSTYLETADRAYHYLVDHFWDIKHGGLYWSLNYDGTIAFSRKQIYAQGFGIYAFSEYYKATKKEESLNYAVQLFELTEKYSHEMMFGGYVEALSKNWTSLDDMRLSEKDANEPKSMNTHLHILESYTNLYTVWKNKKLEGKLKDLINIFLNHILNSSTNHFDLFFDYDWTIKSNKISFGHDIEGSWLLTEAAYALGDFELIKKVEEISIRMVDVTIKEGMDSDASVFNEKENNNLDKDKHWWPQAEALVGLAYAWNISGDENYLKILFETWGFIKDKMIDNKHGEWFWRVSSEGFPYYKDVKLGFWKCPYHNSRALMEVLNLIQID